MLGGITISATVGAALKKIAVMILTNKKVMKKVLIVVVSLIMALLLPVIAVISVLQGNVNIDYNKLQEMVVENMTDEQKAQLAATEKLMNDIESEMKKKDFTDEQVLQARVITVTALGEKVKEKDFIKDLVSCFAKDQTEKNLISNINRKFNTHIEVEEFEKVMSLINTYNADIVKVAAKQLGNAGGEKFWRWYGFSSRVEWCCVFVSWCANECGYIEAGLIPKYAVVDDGVNWFKSKDQWLNGSATPKPGMIIFFDWAYDGSDGSGDHTGIVEKVENGYVYTIEGNSSDKVMENQYSIGSPEILGYGKYKAPERTVSGDAATQAWKYLKSYGYSDSVVAGIIGNMMRECGGDTLDLDWDIIGHFNGDEFYGLCQWCLRYTPSGFKGSSIKEQCEYLHQTIQGEFAAYGGNYHGITYLEFLQADTRTAAEAFCCVYERCGDYANEGPRRANNAERAYNQFHK